MDHLVAEHSNCARQPAYWLVRSGFRVVRSISVQRAVEIVVIHDQAVHSERYDAQIVSQPAGSSASLFKILKVLVIEI